ncbi:MAG: hotdog domain-containing protein [Microthrixaceae bacterium]
MSYPPDEHLLRDLPFEMEQVDELRARAHLVLDPRTLLDGAPDPGPLMTAVDVLAGSLVGRVVAPDWMATAELALHLGDDLPVVGELVLDAAVIRDGRTTVVLDARLRSGTEGPALGEVMLTFVRLPRRDGNLDLSHFPVSYGTRTGFGSAGTGRSGPFGQVLGITAGEPTAGGCRLEVDDYVRNSFGAVNGGVVATLAQRSGRALAAALTGGPVRTTDVVVHYLTQGRFGPLVARAEPVRSGPDEVLARVEVHDTGRPTDRDPSPVVVAHVRSVAAPELP